MKSVVHSLESAVELQPDALLYAFLNAAGEIVDSYTYRRFHERSNYVADFLRRTGAVRRGQPVLLVYPPGLEAAIGFVACVKIGALPAPAPSLESLGLVSSLQKLSGMVIDCGAEVALTTKEHLEHIGQAAARHAEVANWLTDKPLGTVDWCTTDTIQGTCSDLEMQPGSLLFLQYTSGSTQTPRGVMVSHANVLHNCSATVDHCPVGVSWLPHYHDMGLIGYYLFPFLRLGSAYMFSGSHFLRRPRLWLEAITRYRATVSSAPNFAFEYCLREDRIPIDALSGLDLSSLRCFMNASEPVRADTFDRFLARFEPCGLSRKAFVVYYGLAENTLSVTGGGRTHVCVNTHLLEQGRLRLETPKPDGDVRYDQMRLVSCGAPISGVDVRIVDNGTGATLGEDLIGQVWIAGESKAEGYWNNPLLTQSVFKAKLDESDKSTTYLKSGDLGFMHDGELFVCGRIKDLIIAGGRNYYPHDIEAVLESTFANIRQGCVAAFAVPSAKGEVVTILLEARRTNDLPDLEAIAREVRRRCCLEVDVLAIVPHGSIVKTSSGKIARQECRTRWQEGRMQALARLDREKSGAGDHDFITQILLRLDAEQHDEATLAEIGFDSLTLVELCLYFEKVANERGVAGAALFDLRALQAVTVGELKTALTETSTGSFKRAQAAYLRRLRSVENEEISRMRHDARLPAQIEASGQQTIVARKILLTGATGFLGSFLLESILRQTDCEIVAVVRAEDPAHAFRRIESALQRTGVWSDSLRRACSLRVRAIPGDIARPRLGLTTDEWELLVHEITDIYHCGGEVDYVKPYRTLWAPNVSSTLELLRMATTGSQKTLHHISTTFVFGFTVRELCRENDVNHEMAGLNFGYAQTKWVSEQLVHQAVRNGMRARIYRPSFVTASRFGRYVRRDLLTRAFTYLIAHEVAPNSANQISCLPVDVCANNIVALSLLDAPGANMFHLTVDQYQSMGTICESMTRQYGYRFRYIRLAQIIAHLNRHCRRNDPVFPLMPFLNDNFLRIDAMHEKRYANENYRRARELSAATLPEPKLDDVVAGLVTFLQQERLAPVKERRQFTMAK
jgi:thioester reductase-like protein